MPFPVQELSGVEHALSRQDATATASCSAHVSAVQAMKTNRDRFVYEVHQGKKTTFVFAAAITSLRVPTAAQHLRSSWFAALAKHYKPHGARTACPLYAALLKANAAFAKASAYGDNVIAHTSVTAFLLDLNTHEVYTLYYGKGACSPCIESEGYGEPDLVSERMHFVNGVEVHTSSRQLSSGAHTVVIGSSGLWTQVQPQKAVMHARLFAAAKSVVDSSSSHHDPATAVLRAALRNIVTRSAPAKDPRLASLFHIKQLDRLPRGSRQEEAGKGLVPRGRGDIHPDMTALVLSISCSSTLTRANSSRDSCPIKAWFRGSSQSLRLPADEDSRVESSRGSSSSHISASDLLEPFGGHGSPCRAASALYRDLVSSRVLLFSSESNSASRAQSVASPSSPSSPRRGASMSRGPSLTNLSTVQRAASGPTAAELSLTPARRRWRLLRLYVLGVLPSEAALRASMWEGALQSAGKPVAKILCSRGSASPVAAVLGWESASHSGELQSAATTSSLSRTSGSDPGMSAQGQPRRSGQWPVPQRQQLAC